MAKLCKLIKETEKFDKYKDLVRDSKYICKKCGRLAKDSENLCKPEKLKKK